MNKFKKRQIIILAIFAVIAVWVFWPTNTTCDGIFGFVHQAHDSVKIGRSTFAIAADGTVESATFEISGGRGFAGTGFGSNIFDKGIGGNLFFKSKGVTVQLVYEKGMDAPEERESQTSSYSWLMKLEDLELAAEALVEHFPGQAMTANFSASNSGATDSEVRLVGYDGYFRFNLNTGDLEALQESTFYTVKDSLTANVGGKTYLIVF